VDLARLTPISRTIEAHFGLKIKRLDTNPKRMTKNNSYAALALFLLAPVIALAQDEGPVDDAVEAEVFGPDIDDQEIVDPAEQTVPVADVEVENEPLRGVEIDPDATDEERLLAEFERYRMLVNEGILDEADIAAKRIVGLAIKVYGAQSRETANALNNLGIVQHGNGQYDAAIQNFTSSVEIIEQVEDRLNGALVNPLKGLGSAQLSNGRPDQARKTFTRAAHITEVNEGPHNLDQVEILESIAETYIRMGETKEARNTLDRIHIINVKHFEKDPVGLLPSLMNRADWQHRAGYYAEERTTYRRAIRIVEPTSGKNDTLLVEPLRRLGESFYFIDLTLSSPQQHGLISTGELYFKRAARIAEKADDMDWRERTTATLALADYYTFIESQNRSRKIYKDVWVMLADDDEKLAQRDAWFSDPQPLRESPMPPFAGRQPSGGTPPGDLGTGRIVIDYTISTRGRVRDLQSEAFPQEFSDMQRMVHREIRNRVYRPRLVDGVPVDSEDLRLEHTFTYLRSDLEELRKNQERPDGQKKDDQNTDED
jgi:tetratricopeptide (TPR) repeat protein